MLIKQESQKAYASRLMAFLIGTKTLLPLKLWLEGGLSYAKGHQLYVPYGKLCKELLREIHDLKWGEPPGEQQTFIFGEYLAKDER